MREDYSGGPRWDDNRKTTGRPGRLRGDCERARRNTFLSYDLPKPLVRAHIHGKKSEELTPASLSHKYVSLSLIDRRVLLATVSMKRRGNHDVMALATFATIELLAYDSFRSISHLLVILHRPLLPRTKSVLSHTPLIFRPAGSSRTGARASRLLTAARSLGLLGSLGSLRSLGLWQVLHDALLLRHLCAELRGEDVVEVGDLGGVAAPNLPIPGQKVRAKRTTMPCITTSFAPKLGKSAVVQGASQIRVPLPTWRMETADCFGAEPRSPRLWQLGAACPDQLRQKPIDRIGFV